jgi:hypothetical protein
VDDAGRLRRALISAYLSVCVDMRLMRQSRRRWRICDATEAIHALFLYLKKNEKIVGEVA